jgi:hypothetical protein
MTIAFHCAKCDKSLQAPDEAAGQPAKCTGCGATVQVPVVENLRWPPGMRPPGAAASTPPPQPVQPAPTPPPVAGPASVVPQLPAPPPAQPPAHVPPADVALPVPPTVAASNRPPQALPVGRPILRHGFAIPMVTPVAAPQPAPAPVLRSRPAAIGVDAVVARTWEIYKANVSLLFAACIVIQILLVPVSLAVAFGLQRLGVLPIDKVTSDGNLLQTAATYVPPIISIWFFLGGFMMLVNLARGRDADMGDLFSGGGLFFSALVVWLIYYVPHYLLSVACGRLGLAPTEYVVVVMSAGVVISYLLWVPTLLVLVDRTSDPLEAISYALEYVARHFFTLLGLFVVSLCVFAVSLLSCGVGLIFGVPFILLMLTVAYTSNTPEP